jgi:hypothetical protein
VVIGVEGGTALGACGDGARVGVEGPGMQSGEVLGRGRLGARPAGGTGGIVAPGPLVGGGGARKKATRRMVAAAWRWTGERGLGEWVLSKTVRR